MRTARGRLIVALAATGALLAGCAGPADPADPTFLGTVSTWAPGDRGAPVELTGTAFDGQTIDLEQWRGHVVVLNLWYAACPPCRREAPDLVATATDHPQVRFVGINGTDDAATVAAFEDSFSTPYPSINDADGAARAALAGVVSLQAYPTTVVLDASGAVSGRVVGQVDATTLQGLIAQAEQG